MTEARVSTISSFPTSSLGVNCQHGTAMSSQSHHGINYQHSHTVHSITPLSEDVLLTTNMRSTIHAITPWNKKAFQ